MAEEQTDEVRARLRDRLLLIKAALLLVGWRSGSVVHRMNKVTLCWLVSAMP